MLNEIKITIDNTPSKKEEKQSKLQPEMNDSGDSSKMAKLKKSTAAKRKAIAAVKETVKETINIGQDILTQLDYQVENAQINNVKNVVGRVSGAVGGIAAGAAMGGPVGAIAAAAMVAINEVAGGVKRGINWNSKQQENNIQAERASDRLGVIALSGNRNYKL